MSSILLIIHIIRLQNCQYGFPVEWDPPLEGAYVLVVLDLYLYSNPKLFNATMAHAEFNKLMGFKIWWKILFRITSPFKKSQGIRKIFESSGKVHIMNFENSKIRHLGKCFRIAFCLF